MLDGDLKKAFEAYQNRSAHKIYISKEFPFFGNHGNGVYTNRKRYVTKVFDNKSGHDFAEINGEIVLQKSFLTSHQVQATVYTHKDSGKGISLMEFTIQKFYKNEENQLKPVIKSSFSFSQSQFIDLLKLLNDIKFIDFSNKENFKIEANSIETGPMIFNLNKPDPNKILVDKNWIEIINTLSSVSDTERLPILELLKSKVLTKNDLDILSGRKDGLELFRANMDDETLLEPQWQKFFEANSWIFGYGLDYKFLGILQKEASVSSIDIDGKNEVKTDFLLASNEFTVIVELKRPDTPLFADKNRSESWQLSNELTYAVSQILAQKAEWEINAQHKKFDKEGKPIYQHTIDPKAFLIIGNSIQFNGDTKEDLIKRKTFELYRRNMKNIEIITYDELLNRAEFIITNKTA